MKLLIVEDERELSDNIVSYLSSENYVCEQAFSYEEAGMSAKKRPNCPSEKRAAIIDALIHFGMLDEDARETE